jgi:tetratricopeptide (TPR) repeat protein
MVGLLSVDWRVFNEGILSGCRIAAGRDREKSWPKSGSCGPACPAPRGYLSWRSWNGIPDWPGLATQEDTVMKPVKLFTPLLLLPLCVNAQSVTVLSGGGEARACASAAKLSTTRLNPMRNDLDACNRALEEVNLSRRDRAATFVNRGILLAALDEYQDALNDYNDGLELLPELPQAWNGKGNLYYLAQRYDDAIAAYQRALELNLPERQVAHYNLGITYEKLGDEAAAERSFTTALEIAPDWAPAKERLERLKAN